MRSMVLEAFGKPLVPKDRDVPVPEEGEVLLKVGACGVCQTDLKICQGKHPAVRQVPVTPGHEVAGEIVDVGKNVDKGYLGRHAVVYNYNVCGVCEFCRAGRESLCADIRGQVGFSLPGGFAEYLKVPLQCLFLIDKEVPFEKAAVLTDAVATPYHALVSRAELKENEIVAVIGVGGLGVHAIQIAKLLGATVMAIDVKDEALEIAERFGADWCLKGGGDELIGAVRDLTKGRGVDTVVELTGNPGVEEQALNLLKVAGKMVLVAYNINQPFYVNSLLMVSREIEMVGARWCGRDEFRECVRLVAEKKIDPFVSEEHPMQEVNSVLERLQQGDILGRAVLVP